MSPLESEKLMTPASALSDLEWAGFYADDIGFKKLEEMIPAPVEVERSIKNVAGSEKVAEEEEKDGLNYPFAI